MKEKKDGEKEELTVAETATYLGRSTEQVRRYLREGSLVGYHVGNQWFVPATAVAAAAMRLRSPRQEELMKLVEEMRALRQEMLKKYGYLDVSQWVAEARQGLA